MTIAVDLDIKQENKQKHHVCYFQYNQYTGHTWHLGEDNNGGIRISMLRLNLRYIYLVCKNKLHGKTFVKGPLSKRLKLVFKTHYDLMQVKSIAECSP